MTDNEFEKIHDVQLEIMDEIHRLCVENDITYYLVGGSCLGAVRHKGFIPWDPDIDIGMMRNDYEKFCDICNQKLDKKFVYRDYTNTKNYIRPHALVCKKNTRLINIVDKMNPKAENFGIYIDIFPLDKTPLNEKEKEKHAKRLRAIYKFKCYRLPYSYSANPIKRKIHFLVSALLGFIPIKFINKKQQEIMMKYRDIPATAVCSMAGKYTYEKETTPLSVYGKATLSDFEGRKYYVPEKSDAFLTHLYGDYMKYPPLEEIEKCRSVFCEVDFGQMP